jgi:hypothetical protein
MALPARRMLGAGFVCHQYQNRQPFPGLVSKRQGRA